MKFNKYICGVRLADHCFFLSPLVAQQDELSKRQEKQQPKKEKGPALLFVGGRGRPPQEGGVRGSAAPGHRQHQLQGGRGAEDGFRRPGGSSGRRRPPV